MVTAFRPSQVTPPESGSYAVFAFVDICKSSGDEWRVVNISEFCDYVRMVEKMLMPTFVDTMRDFAPFFGIDAENAIAKIDLGRDVLEKLSWQLARDIVVNGWFTHPEDDEDKIIATEKLMEHLQQYIK
jgi:hypothetical protein